MFGLLLIVFVNFVGIGALIPVLPFTVIENLGYSESVMTALLASFALAMFIANPVLGRLSDRFGRRPVLLISLIVGTGAHICFALTNDIVIMFAARIIAGLSAGNIGVIQAIITDSSSAGDRARLMGFLGAAIGSGFVLGPAIGGLLGGIGSGPVHQVPFFVAALFSFVAVCLTVRLRETAAAGRTDGGHSTLLAALGHLFGSRIGMFAAAFFCLNLSFAQVEASFVLLVRDLLGFGPRQTGWLFTYIGVCIIIIQGGMIGRLARHFGDMNVVLGGVLLLCAGQLATALLASAAITSSDYLLIQVIAVTTFICAGFALTNPTLSAVSSKAARAGETGGALGLVQGCGSMGQVIGLTIAGPLYQLGTGAMSFGFGAFVSAVLLVLAFIIARGTAAE